MTSSLSRHKLDIFVDQSPTLSQYLSLKEGLGKIGQTIANVSGSHISGGQNTGPGRMLNKISANLNNCFRHAQHNTQHGTLLHIEKLVCGTCAQSLNI
mmetsp:Transcript_12349/g.17599  ORF Transcript_12349/g.17599 Transcript_12349/m.17599 type:complete len:98 (+) Transcript_12349:385-678(+)